MGTFWVFLLEAENKASSWEGSGRRNGALHQENVSRKASTHRNSALRGSMSEWGGICLIKAPWSHLALQESIQGCFLLHLRSLFVPYLCLWLCLSTQIVQTDVEISLVLDSGFPQCCLQTSLLCTPKASPSPRIQPGLQNHTSGCPGKDSGCSKAEISRASTQSLSQDSCGRGQIWP